MAEVQKGRITVEVESALSQALDLSTPVDHVSKVAQYLLANGTGANQANRMWHDRRTIGQAGEDLDLMGALTDAFGEPLVLTRIKALLIVAAAANVFDVLVSYPPVSDEITVKRGGLCLVVAPDATGYAVGGSPAAPIAVASSGAGSVVYDVIVLGVG